MIKMIRGRFGWPQEDGSVKPMDKDSDAFSASKEQEERLVRDGFAVYVDYTPEAPADGEGEPDEGKALDEMNATELRAYAKELGLTFKVGVTKAKMLEEIRANLASVPDEEDADGEGEPDEDADEEAFDASEAVQ